MTTALLPASWLYGAIMWCRNRAYDAGLLANNSAGVPVICIGNMTAGGTGKTPLVEYIAGYLQGLGKKVAVVSRGYGRESTGCVVVSDGTKVLVDARTGGDEPVQMAKSHPGLVVIVAERRIMAAQLARTSFGADVVLMDDGFQHRSLKRSLDIVVLDARNDLRRVPMLPAGMRREPLAELRRAGLIALSRSDGPESGRWLNGMIEARNIPTVRFDTVTSNVPQGTPLVVFSGIGDHLAFVEAIRKSGGMVVADRQFPDHYWYTKADIELLARMQDEHQESILVTTAKDLARLESIPAAREDFLSRCHVVALPAHVVVEGEEVLHKRIAQALTEGERSC